MADAVISTVRQDKTPPIRMGATPVEVLPSGAKIYEGTAAFGDVVAPYPDLVPPRNEFRPADEVMSPEALRSLEGLAFNAGQRARDFDGRITLPGNHPPDLVNPETVADMLEGVVLRGWREDNRVPGDPPELRVRVIAHTAPLQRLIESGVVDLSLGYTTTDVWEDGEHNGVPYQVVQRGHRYNHLSLVDRARSRAPSGRSSRLDADTPAAQPSYPRPGESPIMNPEVLALLAKTLKMDALSAEDAALLAQMSPEAQKQFAAIAAGAAEGAEAAAENGAAEVPADLAGLTAMIKTLAADVAALKAAKMDAPADPAMGEAAKAKAKKDAEALLRATGVDADRRDSAGMLADPAAVIAAAQRAGSTAGVQAYNTAAALVGHVRKDGYSDVHTTDQAATVMLATVAAHLPVLKGIATEHVKAQRLDALRPLYDQAEAIRRDALTRQQGDDVADIINPRTDADAGTLEMFSAPTRQPRRAST